MMYVIGILLILVGAILIFFQLPMSKTKSEFNQKRQEAINRQELIEGSFSEEDIKDLPEPLQRYFRYCGFIGMKKPTYMQVTYEDVDFIQGGKTLKMDYMQYNFTTQPERVAFIDSSVMGIPFQGLDHYIQGEGGMKGVIAKQLIYLMYRGKK